MRVIACALAVAAVAAVAAACAPDPADTYSVPDAAPATRAPLPSTTVAPADPVGAETDGAGTDGAETGDAVPEPATFEANGEVVQVRSLDNSFIQPLVEIEAGTRVHWINGGRNDHNILPVDETLEWGIDRDTFVPGAEYTLLFDEPGVYPYYCSIHGTQDVGMVGTVIVTAPV